MGAGDAAPSFAAVLGGWRDDDSFRAAFSAGLAASPHASFRWECPPLTRATLGRAFEYVITDAPELLGPADPAPFEAALAAAAAGGAEVVTFPNLSGDALLVVPAPVGPADAYASLAPFLRRAPGGQVRALWRAVAEAVDGRLGAAPLWLSTAGGGVAWLHVRLDSRPKYYIHAPYRRWPERPSDNSV